LYGIGRTATARLIPIAGEIIVTGIAPGERRRHVIVENKASTSCDTIEVDHDIGAFCRRQEQIERPVRIGGIRIVRIDQRYRGRIVVSRYRRQEAPSVPIWYMTGPALEVSASPDFPVSGFQTGEFTGLLIGAERI
jgi:hypothetical protein